MVHGCRTKKKTKKFDSLLYVKVKHKYLFCDSPASGGDVDKVREGFKTKFSVWRISSIAKLALRNISQLLVE